MVCSLWESLDLQLQDVQSTHSLSFLTTPYLTSSTSIYNNLLLTAESLHHTGAVS